MKQNDNINSNLADCLHIIANIISSGTSDEITIGLEKVLRITKQELLSLYESISSESQSNTKSESTIPAQENIAFQESSSTLSIKEFGCDVTSDADFPMRIDLANFAMSRGIQVSKRDSKATIRKRLLASAELRNMDDLIGRDNDE